MTASLSITNNPTNGYTVTINGAAWTWTNAVSLPASQISTTNSAAAATTNLLVEIAGHPLAGVNLSFAGPTNLTIFGIGLTASVSTNWASLVLVTNAQTLTYLVQVPFSTYSTTNQTNIASLLVLALDSFPTNLFGTNSPSLSNYMGLVTTQTVSGLKWFTAANIFSNALQTFYGGLYSSPITTNLVNYGNALVSLGAGLFTTQIGSAAQATGTAATAIGTLAIATGLDTTALGAGAKATNTAATAVGTGAIASGTQSTALGEGAAATNANDLALGQGAFAGGGNSIAIGTGASALFTNSTALGIGASNTAANQLMLGTATQTLVIPGTLSPSLTDSLVTQGTNTFRGQVAYPRKDNATLANGVNSDVNISTNVVVALSGPTGAFSTAGLTGGVDGRIVTLICTNGLAWTILNESGLETTPANRIWTGTGAGLSMNLVPSFANFYYHAGLQRWILLANTAAALSTNLSGLRDLRNNFGALGGTNDDTAAFQAAANSGYAVYVDNLTNYHCATVYFTNNTSFLGFKPHITYNGLGNNWMFYGATNSANCTFDGLWLDGGNGAGLPTVLGGAGGINMVSCGSNCTIRNCEFDSFGVVGVQLFGNENVTQTYANPVVSLHDNGFKWDWIGLSLQSATGLDAEYVHPHDNDFILCQSGLYIAAGNIFSTGGRATDCGMGVNVEPAENAAHGTVANMILNHNSTNAHCTSFANSFSFVGCNFEGGGVIDLVNCNGVDFRSCVLSGGGIQISGAGTNFFRDSGSFSGLPPITLAGGATWAMVVTNNNLDLLTANPAAGGNLNGVFTGSNVFVTGTSSQATNATAAITGTGITNSLGVNATAYLTCSAVTSYLTNAAGLCVKTNTSATYVDAPFQLQAGGCLHAASGLSGTLVPW